MSNLEQRGASSNVYSIATAAVCSLESVEGPVSDAPLSLHKQHKTEMNHGGRRKKGECFSSKRKKTDDKAQWRREEWTERERGTTEEEKWRNENKIMFRIYLFISLISDTLFTKGQTCHLQVCSGKRCISTFLWQQNNCMWPLIHSPSTCCEAHGSPLPVPCPVLLPSSPPQGTSSTSTTTAAALLFTA